MADLDRRIAGLSPAKQALLDRKLGRAASQDTVPVIRRGTGNDGAPLSFAQQRLWLVHQLRPGSPVYNVPRALRLKGKLNLASLEGSLNEIVRRHEALRTVFPTVSGAPVQRILPSLEIPVPVTDLEDMAAENRLPAALKQVLQEYERPFDLTAGPILRARLWRLGPEEHVLLLVMHHIVSDAWTAGIFFEELAALYQAFVEGRPSPLSELPIQYADYAIWQREFLSGDRLRAQLSYWERQLEGAPPVLNLPTDRPRPPITTFRGALFSATLSKDLLEGLKDLGRKEGATTFMMLLTAFNVLLSRYSGQEDIVVGTDVSCRTQVEIERLIGFFVNLLPVRVRLSNKITYRELLSAVKATAIQAYEHQDLPFDKLVEELRPERSTSQNPIVQVLFIMQTTPHAGRKLPGLDVEELEVPITTSKFDLAVFMDEKPDGLRAYWLYNSDLFDPARIATMNRHFETLLRSALADPDARLSTLEMRSEAEKGQEEVEAKRLRQAKSKRLMMTAPEAVGVLLTDAGGQGN